MSNYQFEHVEVPAGAFMSWGPTPGQTVIGKVIEYSVTGGTDYDGNACPALTVELVQPTYSINKQGQRFEHDSGELLTLTCGLANLRRAVQAASLSAGDITKIEFSTTGQNSNGTYKVFDISVARGAGLSAQPAPQQYAQPVPAPAQPAPQPAPATQAQMPWGQPQQAPQWPPAGGQPAPGQRPF